MTTKEVQAKRIKDYLALLRKDNPNFDKEFSMSYLGGLRQDRVGWFISTFKLMQMARRHGIKEEREKQIAEES